MKVNEALKAVKKARQLGIANINDLIKRIEELKPVINALGYEVETVKLKWQNKKWTAILIREKG